MHMHTARFTGPVALAALALAATACTPRAPAVTPVPASEPVPRAEPGEPAPPLPAIPLVQGPLAPKVVYPAAQHLIESRDSNFIFGSVGNGRATLSINGLPARVYPNGAFLAYLPNPPATAPRYDLVASLGNDTARYSLPVRVQDPRAVAVLPLEGRLVVDSGSVVRPAAGAMLRGDEPVRVGVRAPANAAAWVAWGGGSQWLVSPGNNESWSADVPARALRGAAILVVARGADTVRLPLSTVTPADSAPPMWVRIGDIPTLPDTDRLINIRPTPGGTYKWFFLPGTPALMTGRLGNFTRVRLDPMLEVWVSNDDVKPMAAGLPAPRRITANARVRSAPGWVDLVIPIGERPPYFIEEAPNELRLTLYGTRANTDIINYAENDTLLRSVEWEQVADERARYTLHLNQPVFGYLVMWEDGNFVLRVRRVPTIDERHPLRGLTIAVDPGHPPIGSTGPTGLYEADAVLPVGERLRQLLVERGATVVMTRTSPDPVELGLRPIIARRANAHAFVSIHLNAYPDGVNPFTARNGSGTYFFRMFSEPLARPVQRGLVRHMGLPNLGIYYDNLAVVRPAWMPSVLTEAAFVIIPEQEAALRTPEFQERYARGIADGLEEYFRSLRRR